jgi:LysM repeat protein
MSEKGDKVTRRVLKKAHDALHSDVILVPREARSGRSFSVGKLKPALVGGALVLLLALGFLGYRENLGENLKVRIYGPDSPKTVNTYVQKPLPPVPEVKRKEIPKPPGAEEDSASNAAPGLATPQTPGPAQQSPGVLPKESAPVENKEENVTKTDTASPSAEEPGPNPSTPLESPAKDRIANANAVSTRSEPGDAEREITAKGENSNPSAQDLHPAEKSLGPSDFFKVTVKKGETLSRIAARWFPEDRASGEKSILSANPRIHNKNRILAGQILRIPKSGETGSEKQ